MCKVEADFTKIKKLKEDRRPTFTSNSRFCHILNSEVMQDKMEYVSYLLFSVPWLLCVPLDKYAIFSPINSLMK